MRAAVLAALTLAAAGSLWGQDAILCKYPGYPVGEVQGKTIYQRTVLTEPEIIRTQGQQFDAQFNVYNTTPDVVGIMVRIARLKSSEGEHPSDDGDAHGNPRSDEDQVEHRWYVVPGLDPLFVFQGFDSPDGQYDIADSIIFGAANSILFSGLQTEKEYRANLTIWTLFGSDSTVGYVRIPMQEVRFRVEKFQGPGAQVFSVQRGYDWVEEDELARTQIRGRWAGLSPGDPPGFEVVGRDATGSTAVVIGGPLLSEQFAAGVDEILVQGAVEGSPLGVYSLDGSQYFPQIGGGTIVKDICKPTCPTLAPPAVAPPQTPQHNIIRLSWNTVTNATAYDVYRAEQDCSGIYVFRGMTTGLTFEDTVKAKYTYAYKVRAKTQTCAGDFSNCVTAMATGDPCTQLLPPSLSQPINGETEVCVVPSFSWSPVPNATGGYRIEVFTNGTCSGSPYYAANITGTSWTPSSALPAATSCSWHVKALGDDVYYCHGDFSTCRTFTTSTAPLTAPVTVDPGCGATNQFLHPYFSWTPVSGASQYLVEIFTSSSNCASSGAPAYSQMIAAPATEWKAIPTLSANAIYYWRVKPLDGDGCTGPPSSCCSFRTGPSTCPL